MGEIFKFRILLVWMLFIAHTGFSQDLLPDTAIVAFIDNEPVYHREFLQIAGNERASVIRDFRIKAQFEYTSDFWDKQFDNTTPAEVLKKRTLNILVKIKIQQILAKKQGLTDDITYTGFLSSFNKENQRRLNAGKNGQVIYGPVQYNENGYYNYVFTNLVNQLKNTMADKDLGISEESLLRQYQLTKDQAYSNGFNSKIRLIEISRTSGEGKPTITEIQHELTLQLQDSCKKPLINELQFLKTIEPYQNMPDISVRNSEIVFNDTIPSPEDEPSFRITLKETVKELNPENRCRILNKKNALFVIYLIQKQFQGYKTFESCRTSVHSTSVEYNYLKLIDELAQKSTIRLTTAYQHIKF
jgi:hypothetical protein